MFIQHKLQVAAALAMPLPGRLPSSAACLGEVWGSTLCTCACMSRTKRARKVAKLSCVSWRGLGLQPLHTCLHEQD